MAFSDFDLRIGVLEEFAGASSAAEQIAFDFVEGCRAFKAEASRRYESSLRQFQPAKHKRRLYRAAARGRARREAIRRAGGRVLEAHLAKERARVKSHYDRMRAKQPEKYREHCISISKKQGRRSETQRLHRHLFG